MLLVRHGCCNIRRGHSILKELEEEEEDNREQLLLRAYPAGEVVPLMSEDEEELPLGEVVKEPRTYANLLFTLYLPLYWAYLFLGAFLFSQIEGPIEGAFITELRRKRAAFLAKHPCVSGNKTTDTHSSLVFICVRECFVRARGRVLYWFV